MSPIASAKDLRESNEPYVKQNTPDSRGGEGVKTFFSPECKVDACRFLKKRLY